MEQFKLIGGALFSRKWWWVTLLVLGLMAVFMRLGFWQLDRLAQRRAANAILAQTLDAPPQPLTAVTLSPDFTDWRDRAVTVTGEYDLDRQMALKVQNWNGQAGIHLVAPLVAADGETAVLVDRGWIPDSEAYPAQWAQFAETGPLTVTGYVALSQTIANANGANANGANANSANGANALQTEWYRIDIPAMQAQLPYTLLPVYVIQTPPPEGNQTLPFRPPRQIELSEGSHLSYAGQWFLFTLLLAVGYVLYVNKSIAQAKTRG